MPPPGPEARFTEAWPDSFSPQDSRYRRTGFASRVLRRLPGLRPAPRAEWHDLWINYAGIQFEWENGPIHAAVLERLLDPDFGLGGEIELLDGQTLADCYADKQGTVKVCTTQHSAGLIALRRLTDPGTDTSPLTTKLGDHRHAQRDAAERARGYRFARLPDSVPPRDS